MRVNVPVLFLLGNTNLTRYFAGIFLSLLVLVQLKRKTFNLSPIHSSPFPILSPKGFIEKRGKIPESKT